MPDWIDVAPEADLVPGRCKVVDIDDIMVAVYNIDGAFYAIEDTCTHDGGELASGEIEGDEVICPRHGARFCIRSGQALTPPAYEDVATYATRVAGKMLQVANEPDG
ncbi:MAG: non-heme iron oxygenase ferredoxin subunit [Salinisphaera sp.]|nr:non-heme iron oxygenase ferredoxin subunit [Salinisphaera sp.]